MTNLFDINNPDNVIGSYVRYNTGTLVTNASYNTTHYIPVDGGKKYTVSYKGQLAYYDANKVYISGNSDTVNKIILTPDNAVFVRCTVINYLAWLPFKFYLYVELTSAEKLIGKKWCSYGDSITEMNGYQPAVISRYQLISYKCGMGGTGVIDVGETSMSNDVRIATIPIDTDILTIFAGVNDSNSNLGTISDTDATSFCGAYQIMLNKIYVRIPNAEVILVTPIYHTGEISLELFREAVREIANLYQYQLIDMNQSGINNLHATVMLADGTHPTTKGYERISRLFMNKFLTIYP